MSKPVHIKKVTRGRRRRLFLPLVFLLALLLWASAEGPAAPEQSSRPQPPVSAPQALPPPEAEKIAVYHAAKGETMQLALEDYLVGVVAAEMPARFAPEALKAQAVAARTFAAGRLAAGQKLSTDPATCQAWLSEAEQKQRWGENYSVYHTKIQQAVAATSGQMLYYEDKRIEPVYHASCGGSRTEAAQDVWGGARPYLQSVACTHDGDPNNQVRATFALADLGQKLGVSLDALPAALGNSPKLLAISASSPSNRVLDMTIGGEHFTGSAIRQALGLKSTLFSYEIDGDQVTFTTNGYGHGVGLCQYGADYYARCGYDYRQILQHYYTGVTIK